MSETTPLPLSLSARVLQAEIAVLRDQREPRRMTLGGVGRRAQNEGQVLPAHPDPGLSLFLYTPVGAFGSGCLRRSIRLLSTTALSHLPTPSSSTLPPQRNCCLQTRTGTPKLGTTFERNFEGLTNTLLGTDRYGWICRGVT